MYQNMNIVLVLKRMFLKILSYLQVEMLHSIHTKLLEILFLQNILFCCFLVHVKEMAIVDV